MNAHRSLARYVALALPEFELALSAQEGSFARPWCRVAPATPVRSIPRGAHHRELRQSFAVVAFPTDFPVTVDAGMAEAARVERLLLEAFTRGIDAASFSPRSNRAHPMCVPLFDYSSLGAREAATDAHRIGYLRLIEPPALSSFADPNGETAFIVTCDLRVAWSESVAVPAGGPLTQIVGARREA